MVYNAQVSANVLTNNTRFEKSLALLTTRFMDLLQQSSTGVLDIKEATEILQVPQAQRRRIYDITNVLEGVGLIEKTSKQCIRWKGATKNEISGPQAEIKESLLKEIETLDQHEKMLDMQMAMAQQNLMNTFVSHAQQAYLNFEDLCGVFTDDTVVTIKAPSNTDMDIDERQIHLKAMTGRINVMMIEQDDDDNILAASVPVPQQTNPNAARLQSGVATGNSRIKRKMVIPNGPPLKRTRLYGSSEIEGGHSDLMADIENLDKDVFSFSPQSSLGEDGSPPSSLEGEYVTFSMDSIEAESPTFSLELEEGSTQFNFDSVPQEKKYEESPQEGFNRAGMTERYVDSLDKKVSQSIYTPSSKPPGAMIYSTMQQQSSSQPQRTLVTNPPRSIITQNTALFQPVVPQSSVSYRTVPQLSIPSSPGFQSTPSSPSLIPSSPGIQPIPSSNTRTNETNSSKPVPVGSRLISRVVPSKKIFLQPNTIFASGSKQQKVTLQQPRPATSTTSKPNPYVVGPSNPSFNLRASNLSSIPTPSLAELNKFDDDELDLLMKAVSEMDPTNSPEERAMDSFSLDYLAQENYDLGDAGDMFDTLQENNDGKKKSSVIVSNTIF